MILRRLVRGLYKAGLAASASSAQSRSRTAKNKCSVRVVTYIKFKKVGLKLYDEFFMQKTVQFWTLASFFFRNVTVHPLLSTLRFVKSLSLCS